ncbi:MAG: tetratricopeptide repeat protein [Coxiellaceae bacterium]|nr:tetratricopeptide repeat protein [Coxiellaceae bacterium]
MTVVFWLIVTGIALLAMLLVCWPLLHRYDVSSLSQRGLVDRVIVYSDVRSPWLFVAIFILVPATALCLYLYWGNSQHLISYWAKQKQAAIVQAELKKIKDPQAVVTRLEEVVHAQPNRPKGWYLLGKLYLVNKQYDKATEAFGHAHDLLPANIDDTMGYLNAAFFNQHNKLNNKQVKLLHDLIQKHPKQLAATNLLAVDAYNKKHYRLAITLWESLLQHCPAASKDAKLLLAMIADAQKHELNPGVNL